MHFGFPVCIIPIFIHVPNVFIQNRDTLFCVVFRCAIRSTHIQRDKEREQETTTVREWRSEGEWESSGGWLWCWECERVESIANIEYTKYTMLLQCTYSHIAYIIWNSQSYKPFLQRLALLIQLRKILPQFFFPICTFIILRSLVFFSFIYSFFHCFCFLILFCLRAYTYLLPHSHTNFNSPFFFVCAHFWSCTGSLCKPNREPE